MKPKVKKILIVVLSLVLVLSLVMLGLQYMEHQKGEESYELAESLVELPDVALIEAEPEVLPTAQPEQSAEDTETDVGEEEVTVPPDRYGQELAKMDLSSLWEVNEDVLSWIIIPDTVVSYPILQGTDNSFYLSHNWQKQYNVVGSIFMDWQCDSEMQDFNTVIYAHRLNDGNMFGSMWKYKDADYMADHSKVYIVDKNGCHVYEIFAAYEASVRGRTYLLSFTDDEAKQEYIDHCRALSVVKTDVPVTVEDRILTLSTCTLIGNNASRWVVQAVWQQTIPVPTEGEGQTEAIIK